MRSTALRYSSWSSTTSTCGLRNVPVSPRNARSVGIAPRSLKGASARTDSAHMVRDAAEHSASPTNGLVLLVDDEPQVLRALARMIAPDAHRLLLAERIEQVGEALGEPAL